MFLMPTIQKQSRKPNDMKRILFICTGNSARSQMAEALLRHLGGDDYEAYSAGTKPQAQVNSFALEALREREIPIDGLYPKLVNEFVDREIDLVVTVCDRAKQTCPFFPGAKRTEHWSIEDPAEFQGTHEEILVIFRETLDDIERRIRKNILKS
jgi:arsenate reductase